MKLLVLALVLVSVRADSEFKELSNSIIQQMILTPDGKDLHYDALEDIVRILANLNEDTTEQSCHHEHARTEEQSSEHPRVLDNYLTINSPSHGPTKGFSVACDICASLVSIVSRVVLFENIWPKFIDMVQYKLCPAVTGLSQGSCDGYVTLHDPIMKYIIPTAREAPYSICGTLLKKLRCGTQDNIQSLWEIQLPPPLPKEFMPDVPDVNKAPVKDTTKILLFTDIHVDLQYAPGTTAFCRETLCCRNTSVPVHNPVPLNEQAGYWGDYRLCDMPLWSVEDMLRDASERHFDEIDAIIVAGDLAPHDNWLQEQEVHIDIMNMIAEKINETFPNKNVFFTLGNHETVPVNTYSLEGDPKEFSVQWLYDTAADVWMKWLEPEVANATIRNLIHGPSNSTDPYGILQWLVDILEAAEKNGEKVLIFGHVPPSSANCLQAYSWNYYRIISRFAHIISGQIFGHIHKDFFVMYYDAETLTIPKSVAFVGPPATTFSMTNVGYRIFEFNSTTFDMVDHHTYYADIQEHNDKNVTDKMLWRKEYSAREAYNLDDMSAASWDKFTDQMQTDYNLFNSYFKHYHVSLDVEFEPCGFECRRNKLCEAYEGMSKVTSSWCDRFFPTLEDQQEMEWESYRKCSSKFVKKVFN